MAHKNKDQRKAKKSGSQKERSTNKIIFFFYVSHTKQTNLVHRKKVHPTRQHQVDGKAKKRTKANCKSDEKAERNKTRITTIPKFS